MLSNNNIIDKIKGGLIVSCQALSNEPLYSSFIMSRMAYAAQLGGACGIRANTPEDIKKIKEAVDLPVIALFKVKYNDSEVYITPTEAEVDSLMQCRPEIIAIDATSRPRPDSETLDSFFAKVRKKYPDMLFMADCSSFEDGVHAQEIGFDLVSTALSGYTKDTEATQLPDFNLMKQLIDKLDIPVIAEGGIWTPDQLKYAIDIGAHAAVVGTAITRPMEITKRFVDAIKNL